MSDGTPNATMLAEAEKLGYDVSDNLSCWVAIYLITPLVMIRNAWTLLCCVSLSDIE